MDKSTSFLEALEDVVKGKEFENLFVTVPESTSKASIIASYSRYEETLRKDLHINIRIEYNNEKRQSEFLISLGAFGWETQTMEAVDKAFEDLVEKIKSRFEESKFKITKMS